MSEDDQAVLELSALSLSEIAVKQAKGRLEFEKGDVLTGIADLRLRVLHYTTDHSYQLTTCRSLIQDPFDRQSSLNLLAQDVPVIAQDEKFKLHGGIKVIWSAVSPTPIRKITG